MKTKHICLVLVAASLLAGCVKDSIKENISSGQSADLELASVNSTETKTAIDGTTFPQEGHIGLFLFKDEMATELYGESGYENVDYSYNQTKSKWTASPSIKVGSDAGYLYGYYPYSATATDIKAVPVASSLDGDDVMYATKQSVTDATASQTAITMNHALARVSVKVINNGYTGDAQTITTAGTTQECLLVPSKVETGKQAVDLTLTIDGAPKTATLSGDNGVIIAQGTKSNITITLSNSGISVQAISIEDQNVVEVGGHKVTVKLDETVEDIEKDILILAYNDRNCCQVFLSR